MDLNDVKKFLSDNKDSADVQAFLESLGGINVDNVKAFLESTDAGKKLLQSVTDAKVTQGIETFKKNNLDKLITEGVSKKYTEMHPEETADQKRIREIEEKLAASEKKGLLIALKNEALKLLAAKGLSAEVLEYLHIGEDEATMKANVERYIQTHDADVSKAVTAKFKANGREPHVDENETAYKGVNPWKKESFNLTEQAKLMKTLQADVIDQLKRAAGVN